MILSLYDFTGSWSAPYREVGITTVRVDRALPSGLWYPAPFDVTFGIDLGGTDEAAIVADVTEACGFKRPAGILAAPPCDAFTRASAWLWKRWDADGTTEAQLRLIDIVGEMVAWMRPRFWVIENPPGRLWRQDEGGLRQSLGPPRLSFHPWQYGAHAMDDPSSRRTKQTYLWGDFVVPPWAPHPEGPQPYPSHLPPQRRDPIRQMGSRNKVERARTPPGFARAFALVNPTEKE